MLNKKQ